VFSFCVRVFVSLPHSNLSQYAWYYNAAVNLTVKPFLSIVKCVDVFGQERGTVGISNAFGRFLIPPEAGFEMTSNCHGFFGKSFIA